MTQWLKKEKYTCNAGDTGSIPGSGRLPWIKKLQPIPVFLAGKSHGQRNLVVYSPWGCEGRTYQLNHHHRRHQYKFLLLSFSQM